MPRRKDRQIMKRISKLESNVQLKIHDYNITISAGYDSPFILTLNDVTQGDNDTERIGDKITMKRLELKGAFFQGASTSTLARLMIIYDTNNTITAGTQIFNASDQTAVFSPKVWDYRSNYKILFDRTLSIRGWQTSSGDLSIARQISFNLKLNKLTRFLATSTTINHGALKLVYVSNVPDASTKPSLVAYIRLIYTDS